MLVFTATYAPRGRAGAPTTSTFETAPIALLRKDARHAMTPQPEAKCRAQQRGLYNYRTRLCDVYSRLSAVCVVAERGGEAGATWALSTAHGAPGCDHRTGWGVPTYAVAQWRARVVARAPSASSSSSSGGAAATAAYRQALSSRASRSPTCAPRCARRTTCTRGREDHARLARLWDERPRALITAACCS